MAKNILENEQLKELASRLNSKEKKHRFRKLVVIVLVTAAAAAALIALLKKCPCKNCKKKGQKETADDKKDENTEFMNENDYSEDVIDFSDTRTANEEARENCCEKSDANAECSKEDNVPAGEEDSSSEGKSSEEDSSAEDSGACTCEKETTSAEESSCCAANEQQQEE